jgi:hypothetical protein
MMMVIICQSSEGHGCRLAALILALHNLDRARSAPDDDDFLSVAFSLRSPPMEEPSRKDDVDLHSTNSER